MAEGKRIKEWILREFGNVESVPVNEFVEKFRRDFGSLSSYRPILIHTNPYNTTFETWKLKALESWWGWRNLIEVDNVNHMIYFNLSESPEGFSFGIEFEGNVRSEKSMVLDYHSPNRYATIPRWEKQQDPSAYFELCSPVWMDVKQALEDCKKEFKFWIEKNGELVPFFRPNSKYYSIGGHIHVGIGKRKKITEVKALEYVKKIKPFLPYLYYINANGKVGRNISSRMIIKPYTPLKTNEGLRGREEYWLSNEHGTIEFRRFDGNVPAVQLAVAFLMKNIVERYYGETIDVSQFQRETKQLLNYPVKIKNLLDVRSRFEKLNDVSVKELPESIKEVLVLSMSFLKNPSLFQGTFTYEFCKRSAENGEFLLEDNKYVGVKRKVVKMIKEKVNEVNKVGDLINNLYLDSEMEYLMKKQEIDLTKFKFERVDKNQESKIEQLLKSGRKPSFIEMKMWNNMKGKDIRSNFYRLRDLNLEQKERLSVLTRNSITFMEDEEARYYAKVEDGEVIGYVKIMAESGVVIAVGGDVNSEEVRELVDREGLSRSNVG